MTDNGHDFLLTAERSYRVAIAQGFCVCRQVWFDSIIFLRAAVRDTESCLDFIENKNTSVLFGLLADQFQKSILWVDRSTISLTRLGNDGRNLFSIGTHYPFESFKIIEWKCDDKLAHGLRDTRRSRHRDWTATIPIRFHGGISRP